MFLNVVHSLLCLTAVLSRLATACLCVSHRKHKRMHGPLNRLRVKMNFQGLSMLVAWRSVLIRRLCTTWTLAKPKGRPSPPSTLSRHIPLRLVAAALLVFGWRPAAPLVLVLQAGSVAVGQKDLQAGWTMMAGNKVVLQQAQQSRHSRLTSVI